VDRSDDEPVAPTEPGAGEPVEDAVPWKPVFDPDDDLDGLLRVHSPLLSRAFHGRERRPAQ
jgi:hypothetical protein